MQSYPEIEFPAIVTLLELHAKKLARSGEFLIRLKEYLNDRNFRLDEMGTFNEFYQVEFSITCMVEHTILDIPTRLLAMYKEISKESEVSLKLVRIEETLLSYKMVIRIMS